MTSATYSLAIDLDGDELFTGTGEAASADVVTVAGGGTLFACERGRDQIRLLAPPRAGGASFLLNNAAGAYSPSSNLTAGKRVRLTAASGGSTYPLYHGLIDLPSQVAVSSFHKRVSVSTLGTLSRLAGKQLSTALYANVTTDAALGYLLDAAGWPKNAQAHVTSLAPALQLGMGGAAGAETDLSGNGNTGTVTYAAGQRGSAALDDGGDGATTFEEGTTNLAPNPSFEVNTNRWFTNGSGVQSITRITTDSVFGGACCEVVVDGSVGGQGLISDYNAGLKILVSPTTAYTLSAYLKQISGDATVLIGIDWYTSADVYVSTSSTTATRPLSWTRHTFTATSPGTAGYAIIFLRQNAAAAGTYRADGVQFETKASVTSYCDGSLGTGYSWSGTAHASSSSRVATFVSVADAASYRNPFDGGGTVWMLIKPTDSGGSALGGMLYKGNWYLRFDGSRVEFNQQFSTTQGVWQTAIGTMPYDGTAFAIGVDYNSDAAANDPTIRVVNLTTGVLTTYTIGSGLTEIVTPAGTRLSDSGSALEIGRDLGGHYYKGVIDELAIFMTLPTLAQFKAWCARVMNAPRHLDAGLTTMSWWWLDNEDGFAAMNTLLATEGPGACVYEDGTGAIVFKNRQARITEARSTSVQTTFRSSGTEPLIDLPFLYDPGLKDVVNVCQLTVTTRAAQSLAQVWALGSTVTLGANESRSFAARQQDGTPFTGAVAPTTGGGDYTVSAGSLAAAPTLDRTSGAEATVTLVAGSSGATVTGLRLRAQSVPITNTTAIGHTVDTSASQAQYGKRTYRYSPRPDIPVGTAQDFANAVVGIYQNGRPAATVTVMANGDASRMTAALAREIGDRVRVVEGNIPVDLDFTVEQVRHEVRTPATHVTTFGLEQALATNYGVWGSGTWDAAVWGW